MKRTPRRRPVRADGGGVRGGSLQLGAGSGWMFGPTLQLRVGGTTLSLATEAKGWSAGTRAGTVDRMATKRDTREAASAAQVKVADREKVRAISKKIRTRDAELLKRLAR